MKNRFLLIIIYLIAFTSCESPLSKDIQKIKAVPKRSVLILETDNIENAFDRIANNSLWKVVEKEKNVKGITTQIKSLAKYFSDNNLDLSSNEAMISLHNIGLRSFDYIVYFDQQDFPSEDISFLTSNKTSSKEYDNATIDKYEFPALSSPVYISTYKGLVLISRNIILLENSIRQLNSKKSLINNAKFKSLYNSANRKEDFNLLINFSELSDIKSFTKQKEFVSWMSNFSEWIELDISPEGDELFCSGITSTNDSIGNFLGIFKDQKSQNITIDRILPSNTSFSVIYAFENFSKYYRSYQNYLRKQGQFNSFDLNQKKHKIKRTDLFDSWVGNQIAIISLASDNEEVSYNDIVLIKARETALALEALKVISDKTTQDFRGYEVHKIIKKGVFKDFLGASFNKISSPYYIIIEDIVAFSDSRKNLQNLISDYLDGRSLSNYNHFKSLKDDLSSKSNILLYFKNPDFSEFLAKIFPELKPLIKSNIKEISKYKSGAAQLSFDGGNAYTNILLRHSTSNENEVKPIWELEFGAELYPQMSTLVNHYTKGKEVAVQDKNNVLYLISTSGKVLWSKKLKTKILGEIKQVDIFRNKKLQMVFNTEDKIYILDRNGKSLKDFPKKLPWKATAAMGVFDYSKSRDYRFLIPMGKQIRMYDKNGKTVKGFTLTKSFSIINKEPQHFRVKGKDYIVISTIDGHIHVLDRKGKSKFYIKTRYPLGINKFYLIESSSLSKSRFVTNTKDGKLLSIFLNSGIDVTKIDDFNEQTHYLKRGDQTVSISNNVVKWTNQSSTEITDMDDSDFTAPKVYIWNNVNYIIFGSKNSNKVYLYNDKMILQKGFPIYGQYVGTVSDYNNDGNVNFPIIVNNGKGNLMMFSIN